MDKQYGERSWRIWMDDQRKDHTDPKWTAKRDRPKQLQIHNLPTGHVKNTNGTNKGIDLFLANKPRIIPWGTEGCGKGSRALEEQLHIYQHILQVLSFLGIVLRSGRLAKIRRRSLYVSFSGTDSGLGISNIHFKPHNILLNQLTRQPSTLP